jgi:predicted MPP superfamily phosphohydrolase
MLVTMVPGLALWTLVHVYLVWRIASVPVVARRVPRLLLVAVAAVLWMSFLVPRTLERSGAGVVARALEFIGMNWMGVLFLTFVGMLLVDVVTLFGFLLRRFAPRMRGWALAASGALSAIAFVQGFRAPVVRDYEVRLASLPAVQDSTVMVVISDFHLGSLLGERWLAARVAQVEALRPDLIVALGDMIEGHGGGESGLLAGLRRLSAPLGVWAVTGNHEGYGRSRPGAPALEDAGFRVLHNRWEEVRPGLVLAGVDDLSRHHRSSADTGTVENTVDRALAGRPAGATVFLSHSPLQAEKVASAGVGLMLAAHTHGGQIWPFGYLTRMNYPLLAGRYDVGGMPVIVSRGTGTWGPRMRLWRPSEILRVTLRASSQSLANCPIGGQVCRI